MKTKALILAALPGVPMEGMWITIGEAEKWKALVRTEPLGVDVKMTLEVLLTNGLRSVPLVEGLEVRGIKARVVIVKPFKACKYVSVILEEVE